MSRLRNRITKASFWNDAELLRWSREKRFTYKGLWAITEDSGCLEDDPFGWKLILWPSPMDADITVEKLEQWRDELIEAGKLIPYEADGKRYLYAHSFHQHEHPRNPQPPDLPLPPWIQWEKCTNEAGKTYHRYTVSAPTVTVPRRNHDGSTTVPSRNRELKVTPVQSGPVQSGPVLNTKDAAAVSRARAREAEPSVDNGSSSSDASQEEGKTEDSGTNDPVIWELRDELWGIPGWPPDTSGDAKKLLWMQRTYPAANPRTIIAQVKAKAEAGTLKSTPWEAVIAFAKHEQEKADLVSGRTRPAARRVEAPPALSPDEDAAQFAEQAALAKRAREAVDRGLVEARQREAATAGAPL